MKTKKVVTIKNILKNPDENELLKKSLGVIGIGIIVADSSGKVTYINDVKNPSMEGLKKTNIKDWARKFKFRHFNKKTISSAQMPLLKTLKTGKQYSEEILLINKFNEEKYLKVTSIPVINDKKVTGVIALYKDVTDLKEQEIELRNAVHDRELLYTVMESSSDIVVVTDFYGKILYLNKSARDTFKQNLKKDFSKINIEEYHAPESWEKLRNQMIPDAIKNGSSSGNITLLKKNGEILHVSQVLICKKNNENRIDFFASISRDISLLIEKEIELNQQQAYIQSILDANPNLVWVKNPDGKYSFINKRYLDVSGKKIHEVINKHDFEIYGTNSSILEHQIQDRSVVKSKKTILLKGEKYFDHSKNNERWYQTTKTPLKSIDGKVTQVLGVSSDITELKLIEESLKRQSQLNQVISKITTDFLNSDNNNFDRLVKNALKLICEATGMTRATVNNPGIDDKIEYLHIWTKNPDDLLMKGVLSMSKYRMQDFKWAFNQMNEKGYAYSGDMKRQGKNMLEIQLLNEINVKSFFSIPMIGKRHKLKYLVLSAYDSVELSDGDIVFIKTFSQILSTAIDRYNAEELLKNKLQLEELITKISSGFINIESEKISDDIKNALKTVGSYLEADQSYIFDFDYKENTLTLTNYWLSENFEIDLDSYEGLSINHFSWAYNTLRKNGYLGVPNPHELPEEAKRLKENMLYGSVKSMLALPIYFRNKFMGILVFASFKNYHFWSDDFIPLIKIFSQVLGNSMERKSKDDELRESEWLYRTLARNIPGADVFVFDKNQQLKIVEGKNMETFGFSKEEIEGKTLSELIEYNNKLSNPLEINEYSNLLTKVLQGEEFIFEREYGINKFFKIYFFPIRNASGEIVSGMLMSFYISDFINIQKKLEKQALELKSSNEDLEQFAYAASHDLQEPLRMVSSYVHLIGRKLGDNLNSDMKEFIFYATDGVQRMQELINGLLEYSRVERKGKPFSQVDLNKILQSVKFNLHKVISEQDVQILHSDLPVIKGDSSQLTSLFQNLIDNAIKFRGKQSPVIKIGCTEYKNYYSFYVKDNGIGIEQKFFNKIFVIFQRLNNRTQYPGTGIGLAICKKIIERHGGKISINSDVGEGTTFYFDMRK
jgi:PAS domain S-box-containing protein